MNPEEWLHIHARLSAIETVLVAVCKTVAPGPLAQQTVGAKETLKVVALHSAQPDDYANQLEAAVIQNIERLEEAIWGEVPKLTAEPEQ
jgi:hypothetical protein